MDASPTTEADTEQAITFARTLCGIDSSPQSMEAVSQAFGVCAEGGKVWGASAWDPRLAMHAGIHASTVRADLRAESVAALTKAHETFPELALVLLRASPGSPSGASPRQWFTTRHARSWLPGSLPVASSPA
jgi:hypothetical protein